MAAGANLMSLAASGNAKSIEGQVRIMASEMTAAYFLPPILDRFRDQAPDLQIEIVADNGVRDLLLREAGIALRHVRPEQPNLIAKLVSDEPMRFYATGAYVETFGAPRLAEGTRANQFVSFGDFERVVGYLNKIGFELSRKNFRYASNTQLVELEIARKGHAIAIMFDRIASRFPEFQPVLTEVDPFTLPIWLVGHRELQTSRRIRLVYDLLATSLSRRCWPPPANDAKNRWSLLCNRVHQPMTGPVCRALARPFHSQDRGTRRALF